MPPSPSIVSSVDTSATNEKEKGTFEHQENNQPTQKLKTVAEDDIDPEVAKYTNSSIVIDAETNIRIRSLINRRILPIMLITYLTQTLDKGTLAFSSIMGLQTDNNLVGQEYSLLGTGVYLGYIAGEFGMNYLIQRVPIAKFLGTLVIIWGGIVMCHAACSNFAGLMTVRVLLGVFESGVQPCLMALTVMYYKREEHAQVISYWYGMQGLQLVVSGLLSFGIYHVKTYPAWKVLFFTVGGYTVLWGGAILWLLPDSPMKAKIWSEEDKVLMIERLRSNELGSRQKTWKMQQFWESVKDPVVWIMILLQIIAFIIVNGLAIFSNVLVKGLGFSVLQSQLLNLAQGGISLIIFISSAWVARKTEQTILVMIIWLLPAIAGTCVLMAVPVNSSTAPGLLIAFYAVQFVISTGNLLWSLWTRNVAGATKKTTVMTMAFLAYAIGAIIGPQVFQSNAAPRYVSAWITHLVLYLLYILLSIVLRLVLMRRNHMKRKAAEAASGVIAGQEGQANDKEHIEHRNAFADLTDMENPDFRYAY